MENKYSGMTVNERLSVSGLMDHFDKAVQEKNIDKIISILKEVDLDTKEIDAVLSELGFS